MTDVDHDLTGREMLNEGDKAPDFSAPTDEGTPIRLSSLRGEPVVLFFYAKDATPG